MANSSSADLLPVGLVDPAIEALSFVPASSGSRYRKTIYTVLDNEKNVMVLLSRANKTASWGFLTYGNSFPLRVGAVTSDVASRLQKGDEIVAINKLVPESYEDAILLFQRPRLHLELRVRRLGSQNTPPSAPRRAATPCSLSARSNSSAEATLPPSCAMPDLWSSGLVRHSAQVALDNVLRVGQEGCRGGSADVVDRHGSLSADTLGLVLGKHSPEEVWRLVVSRKRSRTRNEVANCAHADACSVLPRPARQAIYDRGNCPFSEEESFTTEFHNAVQYVMTQQALLHGRDADTQDPPITALLAGRDCSRRDPAALLEQIEGKVVCRDEEVKRYKMEEGFARREEELATSHGAMLRVVLPYRAAHERQRSVEAETYLQAERSAQEFLTAYIKAISPNETAAGNGWQKAQQQPRANSLGSRAYELSSPLAPTTATGKMRHCEGATSQLMRLPTPPPPTATGA